MTVISTFTTIAFSTLRSPHRTHTKINPLGTCPLFIAAMNSLWPRNCSRADVIRICFFCLRLGANFSLSRVLRARRVQIISLLRPVITAMRVCVFMCVRSRPEARKMNLARRRRRATGKSVGALASPLVELIFALPSLSRPTIGH
jgi:hypothetical protein